MKLKRGIKFGFQTFEANLYYWSFDYNINSYYHKVFRNPGFGGVQRAKHFHYEKMI